MSDPAAKAASLVAVGCAVHIVQPGDAFCGQFGVVVGAKGGGWYDVRLDVSGAVHKYRPGMFVFCNVELQQNYIQRSRKSPKSGPMPAPAAPSTSAGSPVLAPLQQQLSNLGIKYVSPSISSGAATPQIGGDGGSAGGGAMQLPPLILDDDSAPKFIKGTNIILQPPPLSVREDECETIYHKGCPVRVVDFGDVNQNRTGVTLGCLPSGWVRIKLDPQNKNGDATPLLPSVVLYRYDAVRPLNLCPHPVCSPADVQRLGSAGLQLLTSTQEEALPRTGSPELRSPHAGNRRTRDKSNSSRSPFQRQHPKDRSYYLGDGNGSPMSCSSRGIPIEGLSAANISDSDEDSRGDWSSCSGSELDMLDTANLLFNVAIQHSSMNESSSKSNITSLPGPGIDESDEGVLTKRRSRTYGVFDRGTRVIVTDAKFVQEHGAGCKGTIVFFKGGGWYFLRMDMDCGLGGSNGGVVMFRPSSFQVIEGKGEVSAEDIALAEEKSGFTTVFPNGTRVSIISPNTKGQADDPTGKEGTVVDYKGGGWYFIKLDGVEAVTMSRKGSFVVISLPPESDSASSQTKPVAVEMHPRKQKESSSARSTHYNSHKSKHSPTFNIDDKFSSSSHLTTFGTAHAMNPVSVGSAIQEVGSAVVGCKFSFPNSDRDGRIENRDNSLGTLLSVAMDADSASSQTQSTKTTSKALTSHSSHVSSASSTPSFQSHDVTSYVSFEFRGTLSPATSPHIKPMSQISPLIKPIPSGGEWQKPFTAPVLPVSASPLMQPASSPVVLALMQGSASAFSAGVPPPFMLTNSTSNQVHRSSNLNASFLDGPLHMTPSGNEGDLVAPVTKISCSPTNTDESMLCVKTIDLSSGSTAK